MESFQYGHHEELLQDSLHYLQLCPADKMGEYNMSKEVVFLLKSICSLSPLEGPPV